MKTRGKTLKYTVLTAAMLISFLFVSCGDESPIVGGPVGGLVEEGDGPFAIVIGDVPLINDDPVNPSVVRKTEKSTAMYKERVILTAYIPEDKILGDFKVNNSTIIGNKIDKQEKKDGCDVYEYSFSMPRGRAVITGKWYERNIEGVGLIEGSASNLLTFLSVEGAEPVTLVPDVYDYDVLVPFRYVPVNVIAAGELSDTGIECTSTIQSGYGEVNFTETVTVIPAIMMLFDPIEYESLYPQMKTRTYTLHITREAASKNNDLSSLVLAETHFSFTPEVVEYDVEVPSFTQGLNVVAEAADKLSRVQVQMGLDEFQPIWDLASKEGIGGVSYVEGDPPTTILVKVTSEAATHKLYTLNITRDTREAPPNSPPVISPGIGKYSTTQTFSITKMPKNPPETIIHYTIDGTIPTTDSPLYATPFVHTVPLTIKAIGVFPDGSQSVVATSTYGAPVCDVPVFSLEGGAYIGTTPVTVTSETDSTIYYTLDGTVPTLTSDHVLSGEAIPGAIPATVKAFAAAPNRVASPVLSITYGQLKQDAVVFSGMTKVAPSLGSFNVVTFSSPNADGFWYTVNGVPPNAGAGTYVSGSTVTLKGDAGLNVDGNGRTLKVIAVRDGYDPSDIATEVGFKKAAISSKVLKPDIFFYSALSFEIESAPPNTYLTVNISGTGTGSFRGTTASNGYLSVSYTNDQTGKFQPGSYTAQISAAGYITQTVTFTPTLTVSTW